MVVLIAIVAGVAIPRLVGNERRESLQAVEQIAEMLMMFAHRGSLGERDIALHYDSVSATLMLLRAERDPDRPYDRPEWEIDQWTSPHPLPPGVDIVAARRDGSTLIDRNWLIPISGELGRPTIELVVVGPHGESTVILPAYGMTATIIHPHELTEFIHPRPVDLDATGRTQEPW